MDLVVSTKYKKNTAKKRPLPTDNEVQPISTKKPRKRNNEIEPVAENQLIEQPEHIKKKPQAFQTKCRPGQLVKLINNLNEEQKQAVKDIGFGGLLELKLTQIPHGILNLLLKAFDCTCNMFKTQKLDFLLTKHDVHDIFQLPRGDHSVELASTGKTTAMDDNKLKNTWRAKFGLENTSAAITLKQVHERLTACQTADDDFKRLFVMYNMPVFLAPSINKTLDLKLVKAVVNVRRIKTYDWCAYVFKEMVSGIDVCNKQGRSNITRCILVLMLAYFHRFDFKGEPVPHTLPLIKHWDDTELSNRVDAEKNTKLLGNAPISKIKYPIRQHQPGPKN